MSGRSASSRSSKEKNRRRSARFAQAGIYTRNKRPDYPECAGFHENCPDSINDLKNPPEHCRKCPQFMESEHFKKELSHERLMSFHELFTSIRKGAEENTPKEMEEIKSDIKKTEEN